MRDAVVWLTGPPAAGKTTIARALIARLRAAEWPVLWLDSDELRRVLTPNPTYDERERERFYGALGQLAILAARGGVTVVISATAPRRAFRDQVRAEVPRFVEVLVEAPRAELLRRDPKGLYARARAGEVTALPGVGAPYEPPLAPELRIDTTRLGPEAAAEQIFAALGIAQGGPRERSLV